MMLYGRHLERRIGCKTNGADGCVCLWLQQAGHRQFAVEAAFAILQTPDLVSALLDLVTDTTPDAEDSVQNLLMLVVGRCNDKVRYKSQSGGLYFFW